MFFQLHMNTCSWYKPRFIHAHCVLWLCFVQRQANTTFFVQYGKGKKIDSVSCNVFLKACNVYLPGVLTCKPALVSLSFPEFVFLFITGHAFNDQDRCVCAGYDNGDIKLFDLRNMSLRWETNIKNGVR